MEMMFWQFSNMTMYVRVVGKMQNQHFNVWLFSNPVDKVLILVKSRGQICSIVFLLFLDIVPWIGEQQCIEMLVLHFSSKPDMRGHVGKLPEQHLNVWLCSNPGDKI